MDWITAPVLCALLKSIRDCILPPSVFPKEAKRLMTDPERRLGQLSWRPAGVAKVNHGRPGPYSCVLTFDF